MRILLCLLLSAASILAGNLTERFNLTAKRVLRERAVSRIRLLCSTENTPVSQNTSQYCARFSRATPGRSSSQTNET